MDVSLQLLLEAEQERLSKFLHILSNSKDVHHITNSFKLFLESDGQTQAFVNRQLIPHQRLVQDIVRLEDKLTLANAKISSYATKLDKIESKLYSLCLEAEAEPELGLEHNSRKQAFTTEQLLSLSRRLRLMSAARSKEAQTAEANPEPIITTSTNKDKNSNVNSNKNNNQGKNNKTETGIGIGPKTESDAKDAIETETDTGNESGAAVEAGAQAEDITQLLPFLAPNPLPEIISRSILRLSVDQIQNELLLKIVDPIGDLNSKQERTEEDSEESDDNGNDNASDEDFGLEGMF